MIAEIESPKPTIRIGIVGKYVELHDAYMSVRESLYHAGMSNHRQVEVVWIHSGDWKKARVGKSCRVWTVSSCRVALATGALKARSWQRVRPAKTKFRIWDCVWACK